MSFFDDISLNQVRISALRDRLDAIESRVIPELPTRTVSPELPEREMDEEEEVEKVKKWEKLKTGCISCCTVLAPLAIALL